MSAPTRSVGRTRRTCLAVPGANEKMARKAATLEADEVFLDLEDALAPAQKGSGARAAVVAALRELDWCAPTRAVRVNAVGSPWCLDDLVELVGGAGEVLDCVIVPKVEAASEVHFVSHLLDQLELRHGLKRPIALELQIESPRALVEIERIAAASPRVEALVFGPGDYAASAGMPQLTIGETDSAYPGHVWHYVLARIATTAKAFGLQAIDGPYAELGDLEGLAHSARLSRALGFDGKWVIHPEQIAACNDVYSPSPLELARAARIVAAYAAARDRDGEGAVRFEGTMIDEASYRLAAALVARGPASVPAPAGRLGA